MAKNSWLLSLYSCIGAGRERENVLRHRDLCQFPIVRDRDAIHADSRRLPDGLRVCRAHAIGADAQRATVAGDRHDRARTVSHHTRFAGDYVAGRVWQTILHASYSVTVANYNP